MPKKRKSRTGKIDWLKKITDESDPFLYYLSMDNTVTHGPYQTEEAAYDGFMKEEKMEPLHILGVTRSSKDGTQAEGSVVWESDEVWESDKV